jgi:hypothetical protein
MKVKDARSWHAERWTGPPSACIAQAGHSYRKSGSSDLLATDLPCTCGSAIPRARYTLHFPIGMKKYTPCCTFRCVSFVCRSTRVVPRTPPISSTTDEKNDTMRVTTEYHIRLKGHLADHWSAWFDNLTICNEANGEAMLRGSLPDQPRCTGC